MSEPSNSHESISRESLSRLNERIASEIEAPPRVQSDRELNAAKPKGNWFVRWWNEGVDHRGFPRESVPWIVAFFFSGGPPIAHEIRNISPGGVFVFTEERWYRGTIVRMTLSDRRELIGSKSITVNAMVGRSAEDGVAFQFVFVDDKKQHRGDPPPDPGPLVNVTMEQFTGFLDAIKTAA